jgi:hypothetical protein
VAAPSTTVTSSPSSAAGVAPTKPDTELVLLCHKVLARFDMASSAMETLTRGGGLWCRIQGGR